MKLSLWKKRAFHAAVCLGFCLFFLATFWWNYPSWEFRKSDLSINEERIALDPKIDYALVESQETQQFSRLSTPALLQCLLDSFHFQSAMVYEMPGRAYKRYTEDDAWHSTSACISELERREDGARTILAAYRLFPVWGQKGHDKESHGWTGELGIMELLLSRPEFQKNLTPEEIDSLPTIAAQKQKEKYSYPSYQRPECNLLYTDTYLRPPYPIVFGHYNDKNLWHFMWNFEVLEIHDDIMRSEYNPYYFDHPVNRYLVKHRQEKLLTKIHLKKTDPNVRFDSCKIPQP